MTTEATRRARTLLAVWGGQTISMTGNSLTQFALGIWVYQQTGSVSALGAIFFFALCPNVLLSSFAGVVVDRSSLRLVILASDIAAAVPTLGLALLLATDRLVLWHICVAVAIKSVTNAFRSPAMDASVSILLPKQHFARAYGAMGLGVGVGEMLAPLIGAAVIVAIGLPGVLAIDLVTFAIAAGSIALVRFPPRRTAATTPDDTATRGAVLYGFRYIMARRGLVALLMMSSVTAFFAGLLESALPALVLERYSVRELGIITSVGGAGFVAGGSLISTWGGARRKIHSALWGWLGVGVSIMGVGLAPSPLGVAAAMFGFTFAYPIASGSSQAIWQMATDIAVQGRVFAARNTVRLSAVLLSFLSAGPFVAALARPVGLLSHVGWVSGGSTAQRVAVVLVLAGSLLVALTLVVFLTQGVRHVEDAAAGAVVPAAGHVLDEP